MLARALHHGVISHGGSLGNARSLRSVHEAAGIASLVHHAAAPLAGGWRVLANHRVPDVL